MSAADHSRRAPAIAAADLADGGPLGLLPRLTKRQVELDRRFGPLGPPLAASLVASWTDLVGVPVVAEQFEVQWRAAGLRRAAVVAQLTWPRFRTRVALAIDRPLAHALVDQLLGYQRAAAEFLAQVSPVEWGILAFLAARGLEQLERDPGPLGPWDLTIDRVGPDPFDLVDLGSIVTLRWQVRVGGQVGTARLWLPESLIVLWLAADSHQREPTPAEPTLDHPTATMINNRFGDLASEWRAEVGTVLVAAARLAGLLKPGQLILLDNRPLTGTVSSPVGQLKLVQISQAVKRSFTVGVEPDSAGDRLIVLSLPRNQTIPRNSFMANIFGDRPAGSTPDEPTDSPLDSADLSVTLTVELGRVNIPLRHLASLRPGDVIELNRHSKEPVELSSNGRLVARGELVRVDTELGVRIIQVFF